MAKSNRSRPEREAAGGKEGWTKPYPDFPLSHHPPSDRLYKKIRGRRVYFGHAKKWKAALEKYMAQRDDLYAGRKPRVKPDGLTVRDMCNRFLTVKKHLLDNGEISDRTFHDYYLTCERIVQVLGKDAALADIGPDDFRKLRKDIAEKRGVVALGNEIQRVRSVFKFATDEGLVEQVIRYGQSFQKPSRNTLRRSRAASGKRMFEASELRKIIQAARTPLKAMILLGVNCGYGQTDVANLPQSAIDLDGQWVEHPRPKTGVDRRCPLWSETVAAIREALAVRPTPKDESDGGLAFVTQRGYRWVKTYAKEESGGTPDDAVGKEFAKLLKALALKRPGLSFYGLRHTTETIGGEAKDQVALNHIMGHADTSMAAHYRERISDERLIAVTDHVHHWLFGDAQSQAETEPAAEARDGAES